MKDLLRLYFHYKGYSKKCKPFYRKKAVEKELFISVQKSEKSISFFQKNVEIQIFLIFLL